MPLEIMVFKKPGSSYQDTLVISSASAVFFNPDSLQLKKFKLVNAEMIFTSTTHECIYQQKNAKREIGAHWRAVNVREATDYRFLLFIKKNADSFLVDLDPLDLCGLFLFEPGKDPMQADMMNVETALSDYFKLN